MAELPKCPGNAPPVVRLALRREKCPRGVVAQKLRTPNDIHSFLKTTYGCEAQEWAVAVALGPNSEVLGVQEVALGGISSSMVDPRVLFAGLILMGAQSFIFSHNHPSSSLEPSADDISLTRQLKDAGKILGIRLLDHIIVSGSGFTSFVQRGIMPT